MTKIAGGILLMVALSVGVMLGWVSGAVAATPISACPFTINAPGAYVLTANLASAAGNDCITVAANNVTIDFSGFVIDGAGSGAGVTDGGASHRSIVVRDGTIRGKENVGGLGVGINLSASTDNVVDGMILTRNGSGAFIGLRSVVKNSTIYDNTNLGVHLGNSSSVLDSTIHNSGLAVNGSVTTSHLTVARNTFSQNSSSIPFVILLGDHASVHDNAVISNSAGSAGVRVGLSSLVTRNTVLHNTVGLGISAGPHSTVKDNVANANSGTGIQVGANSDVIANTAIGNGANGINVTCPSTVKFNTAFGNTGTNLNESGAGCTNVGNNAP